jgi:hypothetical protein
MDNFTLRAKMSRMPRRVSTAFLWIIGTFGAFFNVKSNLAAPASAGRRIAAPAKDTPLRAGVYASRFHAESGAAGFPPRFAGRGH